MEKFRSQWFAYAHSNAVMAGLRAHAKSRGDFITDAYAYIDRPGETDQFREMLKVAKQGGRDILYVDSVREFAGRSLSDIKAALTAIQDAGMKIISLSERDYDYRAFMTAIEVLEELTPAYLKSHQGVAVITMFRMGREVREICEAIGWSEADVYEAITEYKRSLEEAGIE